MDPAGGFGTAVTLGVHCVVDEAVEEVMEEGEELVVELVMLEPVIDVEELEELVVELDEEV